MSGKSIVEGWRFALLPISVGSALGVALFMTVRAASIEWYPPPDRPAVMPQIGADAVALLEDLPTVPPSAETPTLLESGEEAVEMRVKALAEELGRMWTRDSENLVRVIENASRAAAESTVSDTLLLAIAHAETNGHILDVSEAGAVGLSQATPVAYLQEGFDGPLFVTNDYLVGSRAYIMKKPLGDADTIASLVIERRRSGTLERAKKLLVSAKKLRRVGVEELDLLRPYAPDAFYQKIEAADAHNKAIFRELEKLLARNNHAELRQFRDRVRKEYRAMKAEQVASWSAYQRELIVERDRRLSERYHGVDLKIVKSADAYEAGEWLGKNFDHRFSPSAMARFLVVHLERKATEARTLKARGRNVEELTAALYNGGSHNVRRMLAGLITRLPETERYMRKVPATRRRLDRRAEELAAGGLYDGTVRLLR
jgi:hypothetical protein